MSKFSIFTLFISATIVVIVAELLVNEYLKYPAIRKSVTASVVADINTHPASQAASNIAGTAGNGDISFDTNFTGTAEDQQKAAEAKVKINFSNLQKAGFGGVTLQRVPFNGILFENIDLRDFKSVPVIQNNLLENNRNRTATFVEFITGSRMLASEIYALLKEKAGKQIGTTINETNQFGDNSFYVNYYDRTENSFLIVKIGDSVYALTYQKGLHDSIKQLLSIISN
jgi:hypothetical protein